METDFWNTPIAYLKSVGPKRAEILAAELEIRVYDDLLHYFPKKYVDRSRVMPIRELRDGDTATIIGRLGRMEMIQSTKSPRLTTTLRDATGYVELTWFQAARHTATKYKEGDEVLCFGRVSTFRDKKQIAHPELEPLPTDPTEALNILPFYGTTEKMKRAYMDSRGMRRMVKQLLEHADKIPENLPAGVLREYRLMSRAEALKNIHFPANFQHLYDARRRLKFEELFFFELVMARRKALFARSRPAPAFVKVGEHFNNFYHRHLPFPLTNAQKRVIREIRADLAKTVQMNRLVQGDVGSGKTIVALFSMLLAVDNGYQAALMAPTEILAEQHYANLSRYLEPLNIRVALIAGSQTKKLRRSAVYGLAAGITHVAVGTHALVEDSVQFYNLGLTIIDEQHKFGVRQRAGLWLKGKDILPHNMMMTATPIPRTLAMTLYGDADVSIIDELPPGRKPVKTEVYSESQRLTVIGFIQKQIAAGRQAYIVYPLVAESSKLDLLAAEQGHEAWQRALPNVRIGIVHGKMKPEAKDVEMKLFKEGVTKILVSTTVIEVGVDVPNATVMVIENSERFGLSQLHQLRGRVGRGGEQSYCLLMTSKNISQEAQKRLDAMCLTNDGFYISQIDLEIRGPGDFLGTRQSGLPDFRVADVTQDADVIQQAKQAAFALVDADPALKDEQHQNCAHHLARYVEKFKLEELSA
jgi:ATP-dependent DNA helicase RecG